MEYDEHEEQDEEMGINQLPASGSYERQKMGGGGGEGPSAARKTGGGGGGGGSFRYRECLKNHAVGIGGHAVDGCGEFLAAGEEGTLDGLRCAACNCHRNFHRKEAAEGEGFHHYPHQHHHPQFSPSAYYRTPHHHHPPSGYLHVTPPGPHRPLALPSTSREDQEDLSNPSSSGGGGGGGGSMSGSKKRFRTKFSHEQKDKMLGFAESLGWRIQKHDEAMVEQFCAETGVKRHVLKVWMHNNKHTLGKKP